MLRLPFCHLSSFPNPMYLSSDVGAKGDGFPLGASQLPNVLSSLCSPKALGPGGQLPETPTLGGEVTPIPVCGLVGASVWGAEVEHWSEAVAFWSPWDGG